MNKPSEPLGLRSPDGREAQLLSVQVHGELLGLMLRLTVQQTWRNTSGAPMATRLAFALAPEQCLLELQAIRAHGPQAITTVARLDTEVCQAGFGVMNTGEQVTLQWRIGQLLDLQGGSLRLQLPAALVPPALRPARLSVELHDPVARGTLGSTSHELQKVRHANGLTLKLLAPHGLDKDFGLSVHGLRDTGFALASPDHSRPGQGTLLVSHSLQLGGATAPQRLRLKLVVDHTGAMGSERQTQVQLALDRLLADLQPGDQLSCSRLGQGLSHDLPRLQPCTEPYVRRARALMRHTELDPGEPDWASVLQAIVDLRDEDEESVQDASVLLVTSHPLAAMRGMVQTLRAAGHRLHVLAVGPAASGSFWPVLARASGGGFEALNPGQHSQQALQRLFERMRSLQPVRAQLALEGQVLADAHQAHASMAAGDTLHLWAPFECPQTPPDLAGCPQWKASLQWQAVDANSSEHRRPDLPVLWDAEGELTQICTNWQMQLIDDYPACNALVVRHELLLPQERRTAITPASSAQPPRPTEVGVPAATVLPMRTAAASQSAPANPLAALVQQFNQQAPAYRHFRAALSATLPRTPTRAVEGLVMQLARRAGNPGRVWALLLYFLHAEHEFHLQAHALQLVDQELASMPLALRGELSAALAPVMQPTRQVA